MHIRILRANLREERKRKRGSAMVSEHGEVLRLKSSEAREGRLCARDLAIRSAKMDKRKA